MSDPGDKISAAFSRYCERWNNHLTEVVAKKEARDALTSVAGMPDIKLPEPATNINGEE